MNVVLSLMRRDQWTTQNNPFRISLHLLHLFVAYSCSAQTKPPWPFIKSSIWCLEEKWN